MNPLLLARGVQALSFAKKHWGKMIAGLFVIAWIWITLGLYNANQDLNLALGASDSAVSVCIADRNNMDNELILLKADIARIQADNDQYKTDIAFAEVVIDGLSNEIVDILDRLDAEVIPDTCEGSVNWMLEKALAR